MNLIAHGPDPSPKKINPGRLETIPLFELKARAMMGIAGMRGAASVDIEELAVMELDVPVPKLRNEVILDTLALYAREGLGVGR